ncbi:uncharacterized protein LOC141724780 [Apium graveolens]|uniref:uncharacterized protein LOC141724780 n=1 Tax=Apium graveolens TaxID=4045 RepID=UPI003D7997AB
MEREWRNNNGFGDHWVFESPLPSSSSSSSLSSSKLCSSPLSVSSCSPFSSHGANYIEHTVSRFDTLAGVAIKYGVEVSDIKKINNLVSDVQMFALKTLQIPPGRHPPSPILTNGSDAQRPRISEQTPPRRRHSDLFESLQSLKLQSPTREVSRAMHSLQGYYHLNAPDEENGLKGCEMAVYQRGESHYLEDGPFDNPSSCMTSSLSIHKKSNSVANGFKLENGVLVDGVSVPESDNFAAWRRPKSETDFTSCAPEKLLKEEPNSNGFSALAGKGLALRPKAATRTVSGANVEIVAQDCVSTAVGDFSLLDSLTGVKKSYSTPSLQDSDNSSSLWPIVNWKQEFQAFSTAAVARPIFDGLPKPVTGRRNKTAVD